MWSPAGELAAQLAEARGPRVPRAARARVEIDMRDASLQVLFGVDRADAVEQTSATAACVAIDTLEGERIVASLGGSGVRDAACDASAEPYDSLNSLLLNSSPAFTLKFNSSLASLLQNVVDERARAEGEEPGT